MRFSTVALATSVSAGVAQWGPSGNGTGVAYTTEVVTALTTYCPEATEITHNGKTYTVTSATTLTITNCPCTLTHPVTWSTPAPATSTPYTTPAAPVKSSSAPYTWSNATATTYTPPAGTGSPATSSPAKFTGAASHLSAAGAGVAAIAGLVAALL